MKCEGSESIAQKDSISCKDPGARELASLVLLEDEIAMDKTCCSVLRCVVVCCSVLRCVVECCSVLQWAACLEQLASTLLLKDEITISSMKYQVTNYRFWHGALLQKSP